MKIQVDNDNNNFVFSEEGASLLVFAKVSESLSKREKIRVKPVDGDFQVFHENHRRYFRDEEPDALGSAPRDFLTFSYVRGKNKKE